MRESIQRHPHNPIAQAIVLPMLLIVAFAAWTATFLSADSAQR